METRPGSEAGGPLGAGRTGHGDLERGARWDRITALAGLLFVLLVLASFFTPDTPDFDSSPEELAAALTDERSGHQMSLLLGFLSDIAFVVFLAGLWSRFRRHEGLGDMMAGLFALGGAAFVASIALSSGVYLALVQAAQTADPTTLPTLAVLDYWIFIAGIPAGVAMMIGATGAILGTHAMPAWLGWISGLVGVLWVLSLGAVFETDEETVLVSIGGFGGFLLFMVWVLAASIVLLMRPRRHADAMT
ncbi:hypothetical protein E4P40_12650 [Blastococcus sp. CT_GayMR20]|uniref:hypothetical protein n=1 Tax=Blastococcus sp. CT_GayMR20 TaxID=2559609 RepID=UPI00107365C1|nr:hypothetical protein [Blastococcus sp. CT_GayMR20]TFV86682.1 hypothetical protein E4P40_12650 [Blastococcus sp. CT_GayMR20]